MNIQSLGYVTPLSYRPTTNAASRENRTLVAETPTSPKAEAFLVDQDDDVGIYDSTGKVSAASIQFETSPPNGYEIYMPTRSGYSSNNLALAVTDPAAEPFSAGLTKQQVTTAAREAINTRYAQMAKDGQPFDYNSFDGTDWYSAFADLDRRALNAIYTDKTGLFSKEETGIARSIMSQQQGLAMGLYSGPTRLKGTFTPAPAVLNSRPEEFMQLAKATVEWLDRLSYDEKTTSPMWVEQRAGNQWVYEHFATGLGIVPDDLSSGFPFVDMFIRAIHELGKLGPGHSLEDTKSYAQVWDIFSQYSQYTEEKSVELYI